jgi:hypothetical protein
MSDSEERNDESELSQLLCDDGMQLSADGSMKARDAVKGVLDLHPSASRLALCTLANLLTKPDSGNATKHWQKAVVDIKTVITEYDYVSDEPERVLSTINDIIDNAFAIGPSA